MIKVLTSGPLTTVQDLGRSGYQSIGVPESGPMDRFAARCANLLLGNMENLPLLEATLIGPTLQFEIGGKICITGGNFQPLLEGRPLENWKVEDVEKGNRLSFKGRKSGARIYIAFQGGISKSILDNVMGSVSTYIQGGFGGIRGRPIKKGDEIFLDDSIAQVPKITITPPDTFPETVNLRIIPGPQDKLFKEDALKVLTSSIYSVSISSNRVGIRLDGPSLSHKKRADVISDGTAFGVIQVPGDGQPIMLACDRGTTGGYAKIATVITADHSKLAQLIPGNTVTFEYSETKSALFEMDRIEEMIRQLLPDKTCLS